MEGGRTLFASPRTKEQKWYVVDVRGKTLGRFSTQVSKILQGKHKAQYTPHEDTGDYVVVINARHVKITGKKVLGKLYYRHSGYPGGIKSITLGNLLSKHPERVIYHSVRGMLPKNKLGRAMLKKLKVYSEDKHPHEAQKPTILKIAS